MVPLQLHGIRAIALDRGPGPDDWLVIALGSDRLVPVETDPSVRKARLAVVVHTQPPPSHDALTMLVRLVSDGAPSSFSGTRGERSSVQWARAVATGILAAIDATPRPGHPWSRSSLLLPGPRPLGRSRA
jgi:hypothetical protein